MVPTRAIALLRISDDDTDEAAGVERQSVDTRKLAERLGWGIGPTETHVIIENDTSAFKRRKIRLPDGTTALRTVRPGFRRALDMLASGEADGLLAYDLDRVARDPRDLEDLIDVVESRRVPTDAVTGSLDLSNDSGITQARIMLAIANKSSRDTSRRVVRALEDLAEQGKWSGGGYRPYGYEGDGSTIRETEAATIRWMADRILEPYEDPKDAWSPHRIAADLNRRGIPPARAAKWNSGSVVSLLTGPRVAGLRTHRGKVVGKAAWPAILTMETWEAVCAVIASRARGNSNTLTRWLTGVLFCSQCGHRLSGAPVGSGKSHRYWCNTSRGGCGKISINAELSEAEVERQILEYLETPSVLETLRSTTSSVAADEARKEAGDDEAQLKELARMWAQKEITLAEYTEARKIIALRLRETKVFLTAAAPRVLRDLLSGNVRAKWAKKMPTERREVVLTLLPGYRVMPHSGGVRTFDPSRLQPIERD
ncbi:recombinase family protein [Streptosporangium canum]|uniref:recombinase family protein n=1 Tax=Streptosporangium canum TaxID=324952 RepID=UPI0033A6EBC0